MATNETKRVPVIETETGNGSLTLKFSDGRELQISPSELATEVRAQAILHGLKQKLVDAAAISRNPETGRSATLDDKYDAVRKVYDRLLSGEWNASKGDGTGSGGLLFKALCEVYPSKTPDEIRAFLDKLDAKQQAALRVNPKVAPVIERLRTPKAAASVDTDGLLGALEG